MYTGKPSLYQTGGRFSLAGLYARRSGLGDATGVMIDCTDPANAGVVDCMGSPGNGGGGIDWTTLLTQGLNDVTQVLAPGTPSPIRVYTPTTTAASSLFSNPFVVIGLAVGAALLLKKAR